MLGLLLGSGASQAHPHYWIDVFSEWQFDRHGMITSVKLRWLFDDYYSVLLVNDAGTTDKDLQAIRDNIMSNTAQHHYFIALEQQGEAVALGTAEQARIGVHDHRIAIEFRLPIAVPLDPRDGDLVYRVAEPTYYFEMLHAEEDPAVLLNDAPPDCRYRVEAPKPDAALIAYAASLGINESGGDELGIQFAETVTIRCE
jgi:ABC-type uncharacterized transport system substrate-binding protein